MARKVSSDSAAPSSGKGTTASRLVALRVAVGLAVIWQAHAKSAVWLAGTSFSAVLSALSRDPALTGMRKSMVASMIPHAGPLGYVLVHGEMALGLCLVAGLFTRASAGGLSLLGVGYLVLAGHTGIPMGVASALIIATSLVLAHDGSGRRWGLDARLARKADVMPFTLLY